MRLEGQHHATTGEGTSHGSQRRVHLGGVMAVVVDQREPASGQRYLAEALEAAADTLKLCQRTCDSALWRLQFDADGHCCERVLDVVQAGKIERELQRLAGKAVGLDVCSEAHAPLLMADASSTHLRMLG